MLGLCERFGQLPSAVLAEDARLHRMLRIEQLGKVEEQAPEYETEGAY